LQLIGAALLIAFFDMTLAMDFTLDSLQIIAGARLSLPQVFDGAGRNGGNHSDGR
jgi:hypothetical protein